MKIDRQHEVIDAPLWDFLKPGLEANISDMAWTYIAGKAMGNDLFSLWGLRYNINLGVEQHEKH